MKLSSALFLSSLCLRGRRLRIIGVVAGLAIGTLVLGLAVVASMGVSRSLRGHLDKTFPSQRVILRPGTMDALWLRFEVASITPQTVARVRSLPGVLRVSPEAAIRFPVSGVGELLGSEYRSDISVTGVEKWALETDGAANYDFTYRRGAVIPAVLSGYFLDLYNTLAQSNHLPKFSPKTVVGQRFQLILGESSLQPLGGLSVPPKAGQRVAVEACQIVGLTSNPDLLGLMIPLEAVEDLNQWYGVADTRYRALHVEMASAEALEGLQQKVRPMGLEVSDRQASWRRVLLVVRLAGIGFTALGVLVFALALAYMASAFAAMLSQRRRELALYRAVGASPRQIMALVMGEIALTGGAGVVAGFGGATVLIFLANRWYRSWLAGRTFLPESLFAIPAYWIPLLGLACWVVALGLAYLRVRWIGREQLAIPLSKS